jgi:hypothetical protein
MINYSYIIQWSCISFLSSVWVIQYLIPHVTIVIHQRMFTGALATMSDSYLLHFFIKPHNLATLHAARSRRLPAINLVSSFLSCRFSLFSFLPCSSPLPNLDAKEHGNHYLQHNRGLGV